VLKLDARGTNTVIFRLQESGGSVHAMSATYGREKSPGAGAHGGPLYLPVYSLFLDLLDRFIENVTSSNQKAEELSTK